MGLRLVRLMVSDVAPGGVRGRLSAIWQETGRLAPFETTEPREARALQMRRDIVRTLNGRRLVTGRSVAFSRDTITGVVMAAGAHDRLGASRYAIVRTIDSKEVYVRLADPDRLPKLGEEVTLGRDASDRQAGLSVDPRGAER